MKVEDVAKLSPEDRFWYWIKERHKIYKLKEKGKPKPWTDDEILQSYFFTNPYRENDKVTVWFRENIRDPLRNRPEVLMVTIIFRWFNLPETGRILMDGVPEETPPNIDHWGYIGNLLTNWDKEEAIDRLSLERKRGNKVFTGAYMINSPGGVPKLEAICERIDKVWQNRESLVEEFERGAFEGKITLREAHELLTEFDGLGGFMAYEVVTDLRHTYLLENAPDKMTWCNPGPGAIRGLYRVLDMDFPKGNNATSPPKPKDWLERMQRLLLKSRTKLRGLPLLEMREIEHSLCEFDKYERMRLGDGRAKRTYNGRG